MMTRPTFLALMIGAAALGGCATTGARTAPTEVTRYHLNQPIAPGSVAVEAAANGTVSPEYRLYADAVSAELSRMGFAPMADSAAGTSTYIAAVTFARTSQGQVRTPPKFSIGLGGGSFGGGRGGGVGLGGGVSTGIGGGVRDVLVSELAVQIRRRSDGTILWEGRAQTGGLAKPGELQPAVGATKLASALFKGFPGESGITTTVR